jgi:3-hydroxyisobutyrate dehydrogenase-like beta-hydroxyacid dehydrogenase
VWTASGASPWPAAEPTDVVFVLVPGDTAADEVLFDCGGVGKTLRDGGLVVLVSPIEAEFTRVGGGPPRRAGIGVVEAFVVEGIGGAPATLLVGCDADDLPSLAPVLRAGAGHVMRAGTVGAAAAMRQLTAAPSASSSAVPVPAGATGTDPR